MDSRLWKASKKKQHLFSVFITLLLLLLATGVDYLLFQLSVENEISIANLALIYILATVLIARYTVGYFYGFTASIISVICINYFFTYPYSNLNFLLDGYPVTFLGMACISLLTSTTTSHMVKQGRLIAEREKLLAEAEKEKMRANLLRAISHDLRTPLTGIIGNSSAYLENETILSEEEKREHINNIYRDSNWLLHMVENLLSVTRIKGDNFSITTSDEAIEEVIAEALQKIGKRYPSSQVQVRIPEDYIQLPMDAVLIEQVIINLVENALVHSHSTLPVELNVTDEADYISITVLDHGVGISPERLDNLFDGLPFSPSHSADSRNGMGIGLSICKTIILAHKGTLTGRNYGDGAEFTFTLPK